MKKTILPILFLIGLVTGANAQSDLGTAAAPADSSDIFLELSLEDLMQVNVTTASKMSQNANKVPATMIVVTEEQITTRGYQTLLDVLRDLPDFKVDENSSEVTSNTITIRGIIGQDKFIIMLDGVRISSPTNEALPVYANYPVNLAEQIEVVYGPASALYGADAVSGIINIITKKGKGDMLNVKASSLVGTNNYTSSTAFINTKLAEDVNLTLSGQFLYDKQADLSKVYSDDPGVNIDAYKTGTINSIYGPMQSNKPITPAYEAPMKGYNVYGSLRFKEFSFSALTNYSQTSSSTSYNTSNSIYNKESYLGRSVTMFNAQHAKKINKVTFTTLLMGSRYASNPNSNYRNVYVGMNYGYKYDAGSMLKAEEQLNWEASDKITVIGGATVEMFKSIPAGGDLEAPVMGSDAVSGIYLGTRSYYRPEGIEAKLFNLVYTNTGVYAQTQYTPSQKISFTLGGRYDHNSRFGGSVNPRAGLVISPTEKTIFKLLYNSAFLAPSPYIAYQHYGSFTTADSGKTYTGDYWHLPNPDLRPIKSKNIELSVRKFIGSNFSITLSSFLTFLSDLVIEAGDEKNMYNGQFLGNKIGYIEMPKNQGKQTNYGGTLLVNHVKTVSRIKFNSYAGLSYVDGRVDHNISATETQKVQIKNVIPVIFRIGTDMTINKFSASVRLIAAGKQRIDFFTDVNNPYERETLNGYQMLNISMRYKVYKGFAVFANFDNTLNQKYYNAVTELTPGSGELLKKAPQNPIRVAGGFSIIF